MYANLCNEKFETQYAFINYGKPEQNYINIDEYDGQSIKCCHGHDLVYASGEIRKSYFKHKNPKDITNNPMSKWHCDWQSHFLLYEIQFKKIKDEQIRDRRADVLLKEYNKVIEFQHSEISLDEVATRKQDYILHNHELIWIIDCNNNCIDIKKLDDSKRIYIEFLRDFWKYKSFTCHECIFLDVNEEIYKIYPSDIKSDMIDVEYPISKSEFIKMLKKNDEFNFRQFNNSQ